MPKPYPENNLHAAIIDMINKQDAYEKQKAWYADYLQRYLDKKRKRWGILGKFIYPQKRYEILLKQFEETKQAF